MWTKISGKPDDGLLQELAFKHGSITVAATIL